MRVLLFLFLFDGTTLNVFSASSGYRRPSASARGSDRLPPLPRPLPLFPTTCTTPPFRESSSNSDPLSPVPSFFVVFTKGGFGCQVASPRPHSTSQNDVELAMHDRASPTTDLSPGSDHDPSRRLVEKTLPQPGKSSWASGVTFRHFSARLDLEPPLFANLERTLLGLRVPSMCIDAQSNTLTHT